MLKPVSIPCVPAVFSLLRVAIGGVALFVLAGCGKEPAAPGRRGGGGPAPVVVGKAERKVAAVALDSIGTVEAIRTTTVRSQVTGMLMKVGFQEGRDVKEGDLLFEIDPRTFQNALRSAEAEAQKVRVQLETANLDVTRYRSLSEQGMVSKEQFQSIQTNQQSLQAALLAAGAAQETARLQLDFCTIRAPIAGRTGTLNVHEGDLVRAGDAGTGLVVINQMSPIYVTFSVPQQYLAPITKYRGAGTLRVVANPAGGDTSAEGELTFLDNAIDPSTGTLKLKATFPNADQRLWPGQFTEIHLVLAAPEMLVIPTVAVQRDQSGSHVFVVKPDGTAEFRTVTIERASGENSVVTSGLNEGETVVTDGQLRVVNGLKVDVKEPASAGTSAAPKAPREKKKAAK